MHPGLPLFPSPTEDVERPSHLVQPGKRTPPSIALALPEQQRGALVHGVLDLLGGGFFVGGGPSVRVRCLGAGRGRGEELVHGAAERHVAGFGHGEADPYECYQAGGGVDDAGRRGLAGRCKMVFFAQSDLLRHPADRGDQAGCNIGNDDLGGWVFSMVEDDDDIGVVWTYLEEPLCASCDCAAFCADV